MSTNFEMIRDQAAGCQSISDLEKLLSQAGVSKGDVFPVMRSAVAAYGRDRAYRQERQKGINALNDEAKQLKKQLSSK